MCAAGGGFSAWGNTWERAYALVVFNERATMKDNCFTKRSSMDIIHIGSFALEVEIVLLRTLWVKRNVGKGTPTKIPEIPIGALRKRGAFVVQPKN